MSTSLRKINAELVRKYGEGQIIMRRAPHGYYYFIGEHEDIAVVDSLYQYNLEGDTTEDIVRYVQGELAKL